MNQQKDEDQKDRDDGVVLAVDCDELKADGAGEIEQSAGSQFVLGDKEAADAEPKREDKGFKADGQEDECQRTVPEPDDRSIEVRVQRGIAALEAAVRQKMMKDRIGFVPIKGWDISARGQTENEEDG